ncbi:hypothetical protein [Falsirhodobacter halotolerans]|uniref:hypothetical protein n=1 Tax=Falsirhodobacter halotolerans TaxID=1146892 RepID=UPI001FD4E031|nr:hypothetical protein [Falsirhodobacter halotolerans]MCJ8140120.1 hypothetical protein [Falsirhodobacter halotolerans]
MAYASPAINFEGEVPYLKIGLKLRSEFGYQLIPPDFHPAHGTDSIMSFDGSDADLDFCGLSIQAT